MRADSARSQPAELADTADRRLDIVVADGAGAVGVDIERQRLGDADGVGELDRALPREAGRDDVLREIARGLCR